MEEAAVEYVQERKDKNRNFVYTQFQHSPLPSLVKGKKTIINYDGYDLFALGSKLKPYALSLNPRYTVDFAPNLMKEGYWQQAAYLKDNGQVVILDEDKRSKLQALVDKHQGSESCLIYEPKAYQLLNIPLPWLEAIAPYICFLLQAFTCQLKGNKVYIVLDRYDDYQGKWESLSLLISSLLLELYKKDGQILSEEDDKEGFVLYDPLDSNLGLYVRE